MTGRWVVRGDPGAGKTTLVRHFAATLARKPDPPRVPVLASLPRLLREGSFLLDRLARRLALAGHKAQGLAAVLDQLGRDGRLVVLLDGLDEVPRELRDDGEQLIRDLAARWPAAPVVVTSRPIGYRRPGSDFVKVDVLELDRDRRREFLARWFGRERRDWRRADGALALLEADPALWELSGNPLYLTLMALLFEEHVTPEAHRARLYDQVFRMLLDSRHRPEGRPLDAHEAVRALLRHLALAMTEDNTDAEPVERLEGRLLREEADPLWRPLDRVQAWHNSRRRFLDDLAARTGILGPHEGEDADWRFWHRTFREALAAEALADRLRAEGPERLLAHARGVQGDEGRWAEPYALLAGHWTDPDDLVRGLVRANRALGLRALATAQGIGDDTLVEVLELTGDWEQRAQVYARVPELVDDPDRALLLLRRLARRTSDGNDLYFLDEAMEAVGRRWPEQAERAAALRQHLTDHLGEPDPDLFERVDTPHDGIVPLWRDCGGLLVAALPVTNAMYRCFDPSRDHPDDQPLHPRIGVTWYQAVSFCRWLARHRPGARLPTEAEWERACRAGTTTTYWSGDAEADLEKVGWYEKNSGGHTHPVGEKAPNPWGLYDVHGNVWEWCADASGPNRVLRGGSFGGGAFGCRSAERIRDEPGDRDGGIGFRVVLPGSPPQ